MKRGEMYLIGFGFLAVLLLKLGLGVGRNVSVRVGCWMKVG